MRMVAYKWSVWGFVGVNFSWYQILFYIKLLAVLAGFSFNQRCILRQTVF